MKKLKIPMLILLTLGLLLLFACLPGIIAAVSDFQAGKRPACRDIRSVRLDISQDGPLSFQDKLSLLKDAQVVDLDQSQATMTEAEVEEAVTVFLQNCESAGVIEPFVPTRLSMQPKLVYDYYDPSSYLVVWSVTILSKKEPNRFLLLDVDDETGVILSISYNVSRSFPMEGVWERNKAVMDRFVSLYFDQLGIPEVTAAPPDTGFAYKEVDGGVSEAVYTFSNSKGETFTILITVDGAGGISVAILP